MRAAVENIEHRHGERYRVYTAQIAVKGHSAKSCRRFGTGKGNRQDRIGAKPRFIIRPINRTHRHIDRLLIGYQHIVELAGNVSINIVDRLLNAFSAEGFIAVAQFTGLIHAGRSAGWDARTGLCTVPQGYAGLHGGIAARVENLPPHHRSNSFVVHSNSAFLKTTGYFFVCIRIT